MKESVPMGANSFVYVTTPMYMVENNENNRVGTPASVPIHLNYFSHLQLWAGLFKALLA